MIDRGGRLKGIVKVSTLSQFLERTSREDKVTRLSKTPLIGKINRRDPMKQGWGTPPLGSPLGSPAVENRWHRLPSGFSRGEPSWLITGLPKAMASTTKRRKKASGRTKSSPPKAVPNTAHATASTKPPRMRGVSFDAVAAAAATATAGAHIAFIKPGLGLSGIQAAVEHEEHGLGLAADGMPAAAANHEEFRVIQTMEYAASLTSRDATPDHSPRPARTATQGARRKTPGTISTPFGTRIPGRGSGYNSPDVGSRGSGENSPSSSPVFGRPPRQKRRSSFTHPVPWAYPNTPAADRTRTTSSSTLFGDCAVESPTTKLLVSALMDPAPFLVTSDTPAARVFSFFRQLNVNVIAVVDYFGCVEGIITRQCFSPEYIARFARAAARNARNSSSSAQQRTALGSRTATPRTPSPRVSSVHEETLRASILRFAGAQDDNSSGADGLRLRTPDSREVDGGASAADISNVSSFGERRAKLGLASFPALTLHVTPHRQRSQ